MGQLLLECEMDSSLFTVLYDTSTEDLDFDSPSPEHSMHVALCSNCTCTWCHMFSSDRSCDNHVVELGSTDLKCIFSPPPFPMSSAVYNSSGHLVHSQP